MELEREIELLGVHAEGEVGRVIVSGAPEIPGETLVEKMGYINTTDDSLLKQCLYEPRGAAQMTINLLQRSCRAEAEYGFIPLQADGAHAMSGSNTMCVVTALLESGLVQAEGPEAVVPLDTPAGLIKATAFWDGKKVERVQIAMPVSFAEHFDHPLEVAGLGTIKTDVAFGGCYFALIRAEELGFAIAPDEARDLVELGARIQAAAAEQIKVQHPEVDAFNRVEYPMFIAGQGASIRNATIIHPGRIDRSPCGTGTSARLAVMLARGEISLADTVSSCSIIGGEFTAKITGTTTCGGREALLPQVAGRAWIYGRHVLGVHPSDPFPLGYTLSDTWGTAAPR
ncbi:proline racemase family protein [Leisingera sp. ANG-Vp]|uniref:proline racemase family protein n=1 Tax=Leisingera sp. ANG-Vp TaxID=1577896 RepID=UPI00057C62BF|nr:proline racemase family protein [Leisingera sp. ANG-Vp]KIC22788.1 proline racemase [Leisingera sp. ANG-Vp]